MLTYVDIRARGDFHIQNMCVYLRTMYVYTYVQLYVRAARICTSTIYTHIR